jgi:putative ABC transport system ATP-binding protein
MSNPSANHAPEPRTPALSPVAGDANAVVTVRDLVKTYAMGAVEVTALRGVNLDLYEGELIVLLGASGSGKSTLLNILGGLDVATSGEVRYREQDLTNADDDELTQYRREHVGFVFQFYNLIPSLTARENVALVTDIAEDPMTAEEALELVDLGSRMDHFPSELSGGEQQRVAIARAIAKRPELLFCDEPTGALDYRTGQVVLTVIDRINRELGATTVVITHNAPIAKMADRVIHLSDGSIREITRNEAKVAPAELTW